MRTNALGHRGPRVSEIGLGTWQLGGEWGAIDPATAHGVLDAAYASGVTFFDTADLYGDGQSETFIGEWLAANPDSEVTVATKMGRRFGPEAEHYTLDNFRTWLDRSRKNLGVDTIDFVQLHTPPTPVYGDDAVFDALDSLVDERVIAAYGVSVKTESEALQAISRPNVAGIQIVFNAFRQKPLDAVLPAAQKAGVGVIARVPLASGLLSGRFTLATTFAPDDHRNFNKSGEAFGVGETFAGVPYEIGVEAAQEFSALVRALVPGASPAQAALAWIIHTPGISAVIPGARTPDQVRANAGATDVNLSQEFFAGVTELYDRYIRAAVHDRW